MGTNRSVISGGDSGNTGFKPSGTADFRARAQAGRPAWQTFPNPRFAEIFGNDPQYLHKHLGPRLSGEILALAKENNPELFLAGLLSLGARCEAEKQIALAAALYAAAADFSPEAARRGHVLAGRGGFGDTFESLSMRALREATELRTILPMAAGQVLGSLARSWCAARVSGALPAWWSRGWAARAWGGIGAWTVETPVFAFGNRLLGAGTDSWTQDLGRSALTLASLKIFGAGFAAAGGNAAGKAWFSQSGLLAGLYLTQGLEEKLGLRAPQDNAARFAGAFASLLSLQVGAQLGRRVLGPSWTAWQQETALRRPQAPGGIFDFQRLGPQAQAASVAGGGSALRLPAEGKNFSRPLLMEELKWKAFQNDVKAISNNPAVVDAKLRHSLPILAHEVAKEHANYHKQPEWHAYLALHDHAGLRSIAELLAASLSKRELNPGTIFDHGKWEDAILAKLTLGDFAWVLGMIDKHGLSSVIRDYVGDGIEWESKFVLASTTIRDSMAVEYARRKGFDKAYFFNIIQTVHNLISLAQDYDVFLGVARGGLYSASVADLLQFPNALIEVHAHGRKRPVSKWIDPQPRQLLNGKRVLILDKDAVTGATIAEMVRQLEPFKPKAIGVYFNHGPRGVDGKTTGPEVPRVLPGRARKRIEALGVKIHYPGNVADVQTEAAFYAAHERLKTPYGRMRHAVRSFEDEILPRAQAAGAVVAGTLAGHWQSAFQIHDSLNPMVPGARRIRGMILDSLDVLAGEFQHLLEKGLRDPSDPATYTHLSRLLEQIKIPEDMAEELARARYHPWAVRLAKERKVRLEHIPHSYTTAFRTVLELMAGDSYDVALIVGPEGFAYEPIFHDLGLPTLSVNVPESKYAGRRSLREIEDLAGLKGKRVLVVEDDVRSGATLRRVLRSVAPHHPADLGLFLGLPGSRQVMESIPKIFRKVFVSDEYREADQLVFLTHLSEREALINVP